MSISANSLRSKPGSQSKLPLYTSPDEVAKYLSRCHELYTWQRRARPATKGGASNTFILQDGPPYANGDLHVGHALNKVIKDIICRAKVAQGMRVDFVPGSDCHGLPVELKALGVLSMRHAKKDGTNAVEVRSTAKSYVEAIIAEHIRTFKSWGIMADWDNHWKTMDRDFELRQLRVFQTIAKHGLIFRSNKPVYWSPSTHTALAEAELEYQEDYISTAALVKFSLDASFCERPLSVVVCATAPWTLPANQAIAINTELEYLTVHSKQHGNLVVAKRRLKFLQETLGEELNVVGQVPSSFLTKNTYSGLPQFDNQPQKRSIIHAGFVTATSGTGFVHCAPGHSLDAFQALQSHIHAGMVQVKAPVDDFGKFTAAASPSNPTLLQGKYCFEEGNESVLQLLNREGLLLASNKFRHSQPIDWRSREPVMVRATSQWFLDISELKPNILTALDEVHFQPRSGKAHLLSFIGNRNEWCISRQRPWGVPLPALYHKRSGEALLTDASIDRIIHVISKRGIDAWWSDAPDDPVWFPKGVAASEYIRGKDTLDVWFDNGSSWSRLATSLNSNMPRDEPRADVYFEGRDQHRCWFQSSVLTSIAFQKSEHPDRPVRAPFRRLMTHGFTLDSSCRKMSKSLGNVTTYQQIISGIKSAIPEKANGDEANCLGPDALRLWAASNDWANDVVIASSTITEVHKSLARYRATIRLLLGTLSDFEPSVELLKSSTFNLDQPHMDQNAILKLLAVVEAVEYHLQTSFEIHKAIAIINAYIIHDLSDTYLESVKDIINSDPAPSARRTSVQVTLYHVFTQLQQMLGPIVPLLIEESYDYTPEVIKTFAGHPLHRIWEPLESGHRGWETKSPKK